MTAQHPTPSDAAPLAAAPSHDTSGGTSSLDADAAEDTPLLGSRSSPGTSRSPSPRDGDTAASASGLRGGRRRRRGSIASSVANMAAAVHIPQTHDPGVAMVLLVLAILAASASGGFFYIPATRLLEDRICREWYLGKGEGGRVGVGDDIPEAMCKVEGIQTRLAFLFATISSLESGIGLVVAYPWAMFADRVGRKPTFLLAQVGMVLDQVWFGMVCLLWPVLPLRAVVLGPLLIFVGGGAPLVSACVGSIVAEIIPEQGRAVAFMRIHLFSLLGNLVSPLAAARFMQATSGSPWPSLIASNALLLLSALLVQFLPEHAVGGNKADAPRKGRSTPRKPPQPVPYADDVDQEDADEVEVEVLADHLFPRPHERVPPQPRPPLHARTASHMRDLATLILSKLSAVGRLPPSLLLILAANLANMPVFLSTLQFMCQYASARFDIPLAKTGYILTAFGAANLLAVVWIIPAVSAWLLRVLGARRRRGLRSAAAGEVAGPSSYTSLNQEDTTAGVQPASSLPPSVAAARDLLMARGSYVFLIVGALVLAASPTLPPFALGLAVFALGSGFSSFIRALSSLYVPADGLARLYTVAAIIDGVGTMAGGPLLAGLWAWGMQISHGDGDGDDARKGWAAGLPYVGIAVLAALAMAALAGVTLPPGKEGGDEEDVGDEASGERGQVANGHVEGVDSGQGDEA